MKGIYAPRGLSHVFIASAFGSDVVSRDAKLDSIQDFIITGIELVYSSYHKAADFRQSALNDRRWDNLRRTYPSLFTNGTAVCRNVCQFGERTDTAARKLTHGFYVYYRNPADPEKTKRELDALTALVASMGVDTSAAPATETPKEEFRIETGPAHSRSRFRKPMKAKDPDACRQPYYGERLKELEAFFAEHIELSKVQLRNKKKPYAEVLLRLDYNGLIRSAHVLSTDERLIGQIRKALSEMHPWHPAVMRGVTVKSDVRFIVERDEMGKMRLKGPVNVHKNFAKCHTTPDDELFDFEVNEEHMVSLPMSAALEVPDANLVKDVLARNPEMKNLVLVVDVTGSMAPYLSQVMRFMAGLVAEQQSRVCCVVLFNDGDGKTSRQKIIGRTGGITVIDGDITLSRLGEAVLASMRAGSGGDVMENNIEALLVATEKCAQCTDVLMIADNWATPRDRELIARVTKPVHWLMCGASGGVNTNYLDLVRANGGMLHTEIADVKNLGLIKEGDRVTVDGAQFELESGRFRRVKDR